MAKLDQPATTYPDWAKDVKNVDEEVYDDLFLREQLLQALATKRAGKAKAIIGVRTLWKIFVCLAFDNL